jgi:hypothetical protein
LKARKAKVVDNDLGVFTIQLTSEPSNTQTQPISVGVDPGKSYALRYVSAQMDRLTA